MNVAFEHVSPESIAYKRGSVYVILNGFHAWQYRQMIWQYGKAEATERYWGLWHKKSDVLSPENVAQSL